MRNVSNLLVKLKVKLQCLTCRRDSIDCLNLFNQWTLAHEVPLRITVGIVQVAGMTSKLGYLIVEDDTVVRDVSVRHFPQGSIRPFTHSIRTTKTTCNYLSI